jgi:thiamine kinase-like enzyme
MMASTLFIHHHNSILEIENEYFMIFDWVDAKSIFPPDIKENHCEKIGEILGKIHSHKIVDIEIRKNYDKFKIFNFDKYLKLGIKFNTVWVNEFSKGIDFIKLINNKICTNSDILLKNTVLSHKDMDPKNVLWNNDEPYIIDWESAGLVNPYQELLTMLLYWCTNQLNELDDTKFNIFYNSYKKFNNCLNVNWDIIILSVYYSKLEWLDYSLKRSLGIEASSNEEKKIGTNQVLYTLKDIQHYYKSEDIIRKRLNN